MDQSHNKPIIEETSPNIDLTAPHFNKDSFDEAVYEHGYDVTLEKAVRCPCRLKANGNARPDCVNCGGSGWIFVNKRSTVIVSQSMNTSVKNNKAWSEDDRGTISVSSRPQDRLSFMDRITILDLESSFSEILFLREFNGKILSTFIYNPTSIELVYLFTDSSQSLTYLTLDEDYTVTNNIFELNYDKYINLLENDHESISISVRYNHNPSYHVIDIPRERTADRRATDNGLECEIEDVSVTREKPQLIVNAIARKAQYAIDKPNLEGLGLVDNSFVENSTVLKDNCQIVNERVSDAEKITCILPTLDFKRTEVVDALTATQVTDLIQAINTNDSMDFFFGTDLTINHVVISGEEGEYKNSTFFGNVSGASYQRNGSGVVLPVTLSVGDTISVTITRSTQSNSDTVKLNKK